MEGDGKTDTFKTLSSQLSKSSEPPKLQQVTVSIFQLPEEIWTIILSQVTGLDRLNLCRSNLSFDSMLGRNKSQWLFDQVFPFLLNHITEKETILKCRQVCKTWKNCVEKVLESEHPDRRPFNKDHIIEKSISCQAAVHSSLHRWLLDYIVFNPSNSHRFLTCPNSAPIGRAILFYIRESWETKKMEEFWKAANAFLKVHGRHIWHFKIVYYHFHIDCVEFYTLLRKCLKSLSNLRSLVIRSNSNEMYSAENKLALECAIKANPLPFNAMLCSLDVDGSPNILHAYILNQYSSSVKKLSFKCSTNLDLDRFDMKLQEVRVKSIREDYVSIRLLKLPSLLFDTCTKLTLDLSLCNSIKGYKFQAFIHQFRGLAHLRITVGAKTCCVYYGTTYQVPSLEYLEIEGNWRHILSFSSLILSFPGLRYLHFRDTSSQGILSELKVKGSLEEEYETMQIAKWLCRKHIYLSPVWDKLSNLKIFTFESVNTNCKATCIRQTVNIWKQRRQQIIHSISNNGKPFPSSDFLKLCAVCGKRCRWETYIIEEQIHKRVAKIY